jgi:hypothetical protein
MTTKELIAKAHKIASKHFDVKSIYFQVSYDYKADEEDICITVFYTFRDKVTNFSAACYRSNTKRDAISQLFRDLKYQIKLELSEIYPKPEISKPTDIIIDLQPDLKIKKP